MEVRGVKNEVRGDKVELVGASLDNICPKKPELHKVHIGVTESPEGWVEEIINNLKNVSGLPDKIKNSLYKLKKANLSEKDRKEKLGILKRLIKYKLPLHLQHSAIKWRKLGFYYICILLAHHLEDTTQKDLKYLKGSIGKDYTNDWFLKHIISQVNIKMGDIDEALKWERASLKSFVSLSREDVISSIVDIPFEEDLLEKSTNYLAIGKTYENRQDFNCAIMAYNRAIKKDPAIKDIADQQITTCIELKKLRFNRTIQELETYKEHKCQK